MALFSFSGNLDWLFFSFLTESKVMGLEQITGPDWISLTTVIIVNLYPLMVGSICAVAFSLYKNRDERGTLYLASRRFGCICPY